MTDEPAAFKAVFVTCRQVRDEVHFIFSVPAEYGTNMLERIGGFPKPGESRWCAIARINQTEGKDGREPPAHEKVLDKPLEQTPPAGVHNPYSRRAGILATNQAFHRFASIDGVPDPSSYAASYIRLICGVKSRKDILPGTDAAEKFDRLATDFACWNEGPRHGL